MIQLAYGVDYITATGKLDTEADAALQACFDAIRFDDMATGYNETKARALGTVGTQLHTMYIGSEGTYRLFRVSGEWANIAAEILALSGGKPNVTRFDCQVTVGRIYDLFQTAKETAVRTRERQKESGQGRKPRTTYIDGGGSGDSFYCGSRSSEVYIRVYDKSREQALVGPPWYWRYEVELKGERARQAFDYYGVSRNISEAPREIVEAFLHRQLVSFPWEHTTDWEPAQIPHASTDDQKQLTWLRTQVRPTVTRLRKKGLLPYIQEALWLDNLEDAE